MLLPLDLMTQARADRNYSATERQCQARGQGTVLRERSPSDLKAVKDEMSNPENGNNKN
jgi:hypothetical protein